MSQACWHRGGRKPTKPRAHFGTVERKPGKPGWYVRFSYQGRRLRRYGGATKRSAEKKCAKLQILADDKTPLPEMLQRVFGDKGGDRIRFADAIDRHLEEAEKRLKPSTYARDSERYAVIRKAAWAKLYADEIRAKDIARWIRGLRSTGAGRKTKKDGLSATTANRYISAVSVVFRWCVWNEYSEHNPAERVPKYSEAGNARDVILDKDQAEALIAAALKDFAPILVLAVYTGMRRGEIVALRWRHVSLDGREVTVDAATCKTGISRTIPLLDRPLAALEQLHRVRRRADGDARVFARSDDRPWTPIMFRRRWDATLRAATSIPAEVRDRLVFHSLRHCFASFLASANQQLPIIASLMGHTVQTTTARYAKLLPAARRAAVDAVTAALSSPETGQGAEKSA